LPGKPQSKRVWDDVPGLGSWSGVDLPPLVR